MTQKEIVETAKRRAKVALEVADQKKPTAKIAKAAKSVKKALDAVELAEAMKGIDAHLGKQRLLLAVDCLVYDVQDLEKALS